MRVHSVSSEEAEAIVCEVVDMEVLACARDVRVASMTVLRRRRVWSSACRAESWEEVGEGWSVVWWEAGVGVCGGSGCLLWEEEEEDDGLLAWCCARWVVSESERSWKRGLVSSVVLLFWLDCGLRDIVEGFQWMSGYESICYVMMVHPRLAR